MQVGASGACMNEVPSYLRYYLETFCTSGRVPCPQSRRLDATTISYVMLADRERKRR